MEFFTRPLSPYLLILHTGNCEIDVLSLKKIYAKQISFSNLWLLLFDSIIYRHDTSLFLEVI